MSVFDQVEKNLIERGYTVKIFATGAEAAAYLDKEIDGLTVGIGGSATVRDIGLYELLMSAYGLAAALAICAVAYDWCYRREDAQGSEASEPLWSARKRRARTQTVK